MKLLIGMMICLSLMISGCGFHGTLINKDGETIKWKANRPCVIKKGDFEVDGKGEPLLNIRMPDVVGGKIGG